MAKDLRGTEDGTQDFRRCPSPMAGPAEQREGGQARLAEFCETVHASTLCLLGTRVSALSPCCGPWTFGGHLGRPERVPLWDSGSTPSDHPTFPRPVGVYLCTQQATGTLKTQNDRCSPAAPAHSPALKLLTVRVPGSEPSGAQNPRGQAGQELWPLSLSLGSHTRQRWGLFHGLSSPDGPVWPAAALTGRGSSSCSGLWLTLVSRTSRT